MKKGAHDKSISELEGWTWTDPIPSADDSSGTVLRFYRLHRSPIKDLEVGDLRFLIGQNAALEHLVPIALDQLRKNPFIETDYYPGDLLNALFAINTEPNYWKAHPDQRQILIGLYEESLRRMPTGEMSTGDLKRIEREYEKFKAHRG
ncbi:MAG: hypothetical protein H6592_12915 [Flavobacteriales bacterium]|nr:hypothetical protein [Flavobacteriales bacterium]